MSYPKIVYTSAGGAEQTLNFLFPPRQVPGYRKTAVRHDNVSTAGVRESILERVDEFLEFAMDSIQSGSDLAAWRAFLDHALTGATFAYFPDSSQGAFANYTLEDTETQIEYRSPGIYQLRVRMRKQIQ